MNKNDILKYKDMFLNETSEILSSLNQNLLNLENSPDNTGIINEIFRGAHTIKGMAATMGFETFSKLAHEMENVLDKIRKKELTASSSVTDSLLECIDWFSVLLNAVKDDSYESVDISKILKQLQQLSQHPQEPNSDISSAIIQTQKTQQLTSIRVDVNLLNELMNLIGELLIYRTKLGQIAESLNVDSLSRTLHQTNRLMDIVQEKILKTRIVPVEQIFNRFPRLIRDLSKNYQKEVEFIIEGADIGIDRLLLDDIAESLTHLINNAVSHGIEKSEERTMKNKPKTGRIKLTAKREKGYVTIELSDDGAGIDTEKIKKQAVTMGIISKEETESMTNQEALMLITSPKFSTAETVTASSGRGVGMDVVKTKVEQSGGTLSIESALGTGSKFLLRLPVTLAIIQTLLVKVGEHLFYVPFLSTRELINIGENEVLSINGKKYIKIKSENISLINLADVFAIKSNGTGRADRLTIVIVEVNNQKKGLIVDNIIKQQEIVIKPLPEMLKDIKFFSGAAITADGKVTLVLDINVLT